MKRTHRQAMTGGGSGASSTPLNISLAKNTGPPNKNQEMVNNDSGGNVAANAKVQLVEGIELSDRERTYLLPHFTMVLVGKPGSGKTSLIRTLLNNKDFYNRKFDNVLLMSPSAGKMGITVRKPALNTNNNFSLRWIEERLLAFNRTQVERITRRLRELDILEKFDIERLNGQLFEQIDQTRPSQTERKNQRMSNGGHGGAPAGWNLISQGDRFFQKDFFVQKAIRAMPQSNMFRAKVAPGQKTLPQYVDEMHNLYVKRLPPEDRNRLYMNVLIVMDDMVSQIKANEFNPLLTQLIFNRRHLLVNGMVSIIIASQKYTMIPARVRSNANWLVLFRLNPIDFENVYRDVVMLQQRQWEQLIEFVFGKLSAAEGVGDEETKKTATNERIKKFTSLGIWVEVDRFFLNFKPLEITVK